MRVVHLKVGRRSSLRVEHGYANSRRAKDQYHYPAFVLKYLLSMASRRDLESFGAAKHESLHE